MNYCENCNCLCGGEICPVCGNENLREARENDFCLLTESETGIAGMFGDFLQNDGIPFQSVPSGSGIRTVFPLPLERRKIYVPFAYYERARALFIDFFEKTTDNSRCKRLLDNLGWLKIEKRLAKKTAKKFKLAEEDLLGFCREKIEHADKISDEGDICGDTKGGHYILIYSGDTMLMVNSSSFEILSVNKIR